MYSKKMRTKPPMKTFASPYTKSFAKDNLSFNNWELCDKISFKRPKMVFWTQ